ncbi:MAG TPA: protein-arginine deiminase family protein [Myxococcales bacterium]|jgi:protein-arginine deiminase
MLRHFGALLLAGALLFPTSGCNCGGDPAAGNPDSAAPGGEDASETGLDASKTKADTGYVQHPDASVVVGVDTGLTPGLDASTQPGPDGSTQPGLDASTQPGPDASAQPGFDASTLPGLDAATQPGPDASIVLDYDAGSLGTIIVDLRADVNRNGTVDLTDPTEDLDEDTWDSTHGAIFLANIDDDLKACTWSSSTTDTTLAACNDAADTKINGADDLLDLARLKTVPWPGAPGDAVGNLAVTNAANVRLFIDQGAGTWTVFTPGTSTLSATQIRAGVEFGIEAKDIVRNSTVWDGYCDVTLTVTGTGMASTNDKVRLRVAPIITRHHLAPPLRLYATPINDPSSPPFIADLKSAMTASGITNPLFNITADDQWTQDYFETAYMSMPSVGGQHVIDVNVRSANKSRDGQYALRSGGRAVFTQLRGKDVAGIMQYSNHADSMDTLDSFGNLETVPPYSWNGRSYPLGRTYRGSVPTWHPDSSVTTMFESQQVQPPLYVDTSFLLVGHVDETVTFLKANNSRGWTIAIADPTLAKTMLEAEETAGHGSAVLFAGMYWPDNWGYTPADITITDLLNDTAVMSASATAAAGIADQVAKLKMETGITDAEILHFPILFQNLNGSAVAYMVGTANGISLGDAHYGAPEPHGPVIGGVDILKTQLTTELAKVGITPHWVENWDLYHVLDGEIHCGSNTTRQVPATERWWESGR